MVEETSRLLSRENGKNIFEPTLKFNFNVISMWSLFFCIAHVTEAW